MGLARFGISALLSLTLATTGCSAVENAAADGIPDEAAADGARTIVVHRSEACDCCGAYEAYLEQHGWQVERIVHDDLVPIKDGFGVPARQRSCHTSEVSGYAIEGHVPIEAIEDLLARAPEAAGISLAGMPAGSPGMPGTQDAPFEVKLFIDGEVVGELGTY
jgi:hypothetical protein